MARAEVTTRPLKSGRLHARWGLLVVTVLLGALLIGSTASSYLGAVDVSATIARGQAESFLHSALSEVTPAGEPPNDAAAARVLTREQVRGLRYVAFLAPDGSVISSAGTPEATSLPRDVGQVVTVGGRTRVLLSLPRLSDLGAPGAPSMPGGPRADSFPPRPGFVPPARPPSVLLDFEPVLSEQMVARASRNLLVSGIVAGVLIVAALVLFRLYARAEAADEQLTRKRHLLALGEMSAVLAHEIRNPLASLKGHAQLLAETAPAGSKEKKRVDRIVHEAQRLEALTEQLLNLARSGQVTLQGVSPAALLEEAANDVGRDRVLLTVESAPPSWPLDPMRMRQVLTNLLTNAAQASPSGAAIYVDARLDDGQLVITVRDEGAGVPPGAEERIFEAFHTTRTRGTGIGLTVARRIVELHGGKITAENHPEGGALFRVSIPKVWSGGGK